MGTLVHNIVTISILITLFVILTSLSKIKRALFSNKHKLNYIMAISDQIKAQAAEFAAVAEALAADMAFVKAKLEAQEGGLTAAEAQELATILGTSLDKLKATEAVIDSTPEVEPPVEEPTEPTEPPVEPPVVPGE